MDIVLLCWRGDGVGQQIIVLAYLAVRFFDTVSCLLSDHLNYSLKSKDLGTVQVKR